VYVYEYRIEDTITMAPVSKNLRTDRIPVSVITGFLGSGKNHAFERIAQTPRDGRHRRHY
jgi:hypothetical protein